MGHYNVVPTIVSYTLTFNMKMASISSFLAVAILHVYSVSANPSAFDL